MIEERIRLILEEFGHVPEPEEIEKVYSSYYDGISRRMPGDARKVLELLRDNGFRESLESKVDTIESPITFDQKKATYEIFTKERIIVPYGTGTGKTHSAIAVSYLIKQSGKKLKTVIISPKANDLKQQWASRILKYSQHPEKEKIVIIHNEKYNGSDGVPVIWDVNDEKSQKILSESDFIIINYHMVPKWKGLLPKNAYAIIDEAHNLMDENRFLASNIKQLVNGYEYLALLTATPMRNSIEDVVYHVRLVSRDDDFKIPSVVKNRTQVVRNHLRQYFVLPIVSIEDNLYTNDGRKVKKKEYFVPVELNKAHQEFYNRLFEAEGNDIIRLTALREAALDPGILFLSRNGSQEEQRQIRRFIDSIFDKNPEIESEIYEKAVEIAKENYSKYKKTVIYTDFVTGVTDKLKSLLENAGVPTLVSGEDTAESINKLFQIEPEIGAIIGSPKSIGEGASYTSANNTIFLIPPYEYYKIIQGIGRLIRPGQQNEDVNVHYLYAQGTINHGILSQTLRKGSGIIKVLNGIDIPQEQLDEVLNDRLVSSKTIRPYLHPLNEKELVRSLIGLLSNNELENLEKILNLEIKISDKISRTIAEIFANYYNSAFDSSYHANVARAYSKILDNFSLEKILDAAGGAATASRILGKPTTVIDINQFQLEVGRKACEELGINNEYVKQPLQNMDIKEDFYDSVVYSLALNWATKQERVKILRNLNRSLKKDGKLVLTLPKSIVDENITAKLEEGFEKLGFEVIGEYSGNVISPQDSEFGVYILTAKKVKYVEDSVSSDYFDMKKYGNIKRVKPKDFDVEDILRKEIDKIYSKQKDRKKVLNEFEFDDGRAHGNDSSIKEDIISSLRKISPKKVKTLAAQLVKRYEPKVLYDTCERLLDAVDATYLNDKFTYKKIEKLFDYLSRKI